ncbi:helix-turn-helix domain-containing protein [Streptomyces sp. NPDC002564]|uniref:helix-turn-helix domain-containing protein n=1 Tax=Streptomyces sp. NPDC002564 TaxID=3364649 RepID=UPI0036A1689A
MHDEPWQRLLAALDAIEAIADPEERVRVQSTAAREVRRRSGAWAEERAALSRDLRDSGSSVRAIAGRLGVHPTTVQDALRGYKGSGRNRARGSGDGP